jgi:hypothetical protein
MIHFANSGCFPEEAAVLYPASKLCAIVHKADLCLLPSMIALWIRSRNAQEIVRGLEKRITMKNYAVAA